ncbi:hypothetical protein ROZALSC1DRAFT_27662 [Rozella allomycis CSF55]|uniref:Uncharacterized protein n=1 Tax=Rozella allomycis (strain CSF55) TaxID=988480 RepID=A0A4P9YMV4_ROZAC|nr:hypothetical protein ROZALSC1DRAFT_27662 [Rozella allomycis CSF55]
MEQRRSSSIKSLSDLELEKEGVSSFNDSIPFMKVDKASDHELESTTSGNLENQKIENITKGSDVLGPDIAREVHVGEVESNIVHDHYLLIAKINDLENLNKEKDGIILELKNKDEIKLNEERGVKRPHSVNISKLISRHLYNINNVTHVSRKQEIIKEKICLEEIGEDGVLKVVQHAIRKIEENHALKSTLENMKKEKETYQNSVQKEITQYKSVVSSMAKKLYTAQVDNERLKKKFELFKQKVQKSSDYYNMQNDLTERSRTLNSYLINALHASDINKIENRQRNEKLFINKLADP